MIDRLEELIAASDYDELERYASDSLDAIVIDWGDEEDGIVELIAALLPDDSLTWEWDDADESKIDMLLTFNGKQEAAGLRMSPVDRSILICALNRIMHGFYEIRAYASSVGTGDTIYVFMQSRAWWDRMDARYPEQMARVFVRFAEGTNIFAVTAAEAAAAQPKPWDEAVAAAKESRARSRAAFQTSQPATGYTPPTALQGEPRTASPKGISCGGSVLLVAALCVLALHLF